MGVILEFEVYYPNWRNVSAHFEKKCACRVDKHPVRTTPCLFAWNCEPLDNV
jgi:hypothetical protein